MPQSPCPGSKAQNRSRSTNTYLPHPKEQPPTEDIGMNNNNDTTDRPVTTQKHKDTKETHNDNHHSPGHTPPSHKGHSYNAMHPNDVNNIKQNQIELHRKSCCRPRASSLTSEIIRNKRSPSTGNNEIITSLGDQPNRTEVTNQSSMASSALRRETSSSALDVERSNFRSQTAKAARSHSALCPNPKPC